MTPSELYPQLVLDGVSYDYFIDVSGGRIFNANRQLAVNEHSSKYHRIKISKDKKLQISDQLHRIIWRFANQLPIPTGYVVHHKDENKVNNSISNLACITQSQNIAETYKIRPGCRNKVNGRVVSYPIIATKLSDGVETHYDSAASAGKKLNINSGGIWFVLSGARHIARSKTDQEKYGFRYVD